MNRLTAQRIRENDYPAVALLIEAIAKAKTVRSLTPTKFRAQRFYTPEQIVQSVRSVFPDNQMSEETIRDLLQRGRHSGFFLANRASMEDPIVYAINYNMNRHFSNRNIQRALNPNYDEDNVFFVTPVLFDPFAKGDLNAATW